MNSKADLTALQALQIARAMLREPEANAVASAWMAAIEKLPDAPATAMACYRVDDLGQSLHPVAGMGACVGKLPTVSMADIEHPAVYCLVQRAPCLVATIPVGSESLRVMVAAMKSGPGVLAIPLIDTVASRAIAVLVLAGPAEMLRRFQCSAEWSAMTSLFQHALAHAAALNRPSGSPGLAKASSGEAADLIRDSLVGRSVPARRLRAEIRAAAESRLSVLITGETGTGKDHAASLIHRASARRGKAFVPLNCAAIAPDLIAAELFGAAKGAYTGAVSDRPGLVAAADGGTLFLDEIGDMPLALQGTLLRLLNEKTYRPLGEVRERASDFRLICATHRPLLDSVRKGLFREDLYYRIRQLTLIVPPLRERRTDIPLLVAHVLGRLGDARGAPSVAVSECANLRLQQHSYPGNIRELATLIEVACERASSNGIDGSLIESLLRQPTSVETSAGDAAVDAGNELAHSLSLSEARDQFERRVIASRLRHFNGSRARTARSLEIARRTLLYKCKRLGLEDTP